MSDNKRARRFIALLAPCKELLAKYLLKNTLNRDDAHDLFQDTIEIAFENLDQLRSEKSFKPWLFRCARTAISRKYKKKASQEQSLDMLYEANPSDEIFIAQEDGIEEKLINKFDHMMIRKYVSTLSYTQRVFISLRYGEGLPYKKIAEMLGSTEDYLGVLNHRILKAIRKRGGLLDDEQGEK